MARTEMFPGKCCCELEVQSKTPSPGYTRKLAFLLEHCVRKWNEKLAYTVQVKHIIEQCLLTRWGLSLDSTLPVSCSGRRIKVSMNYAKTLCSFTE